MTLTTQDTLAQILQRGGGLVLHPAGPKIWAPESLVPLVKAHRNQIRAILAMSSTEYARHGVPLAMLVPWASERFALTPKAIRVPGIDRERVWTISELNDLLTSCGHSPRTVLDGLMVFASSPADRE